MNWTAVFDDAYPVAGASPAELEQLVAEVGRPLPPSYLSFLAQSNGGEFRKGERWFQFHPALDPSMGVRAMTVAYDLPRFMPDAISFALNGGGTHYLIDLRAEAVDGEYPVVCSHSGNLGWASDECLKIADSFMAACSGQSNVEEELRRSR